MKIRNIEVSESGTGEITKEYAEKTFNELLAFQGYGFCFPYDTHVECMEKGTCELCQLEIGDHVSAPAPQGIKWVEVVDIFHNGTQRTYEYGFHNGMKIESTPNHKYVCEDGMLHEMKDILPNTIYPFSRMSFISCSIPSSQTYLWFGVDSIFMPLWKPYS